MFIRASLADSVLSKAADLEILKPLAQSLDFGGEAEALAIVVRLRVIAGDLELQLIDLSDQVLQ